MLCLQALGWWRWRWQCLSLKYHLQQARETNGKTGLDMCMVLLNQNSVSDGCMLWRNRMYSYICTILIIPTQYFSLVSSRCACVLTKRSCITDTYAIPSCYRTPNGPLHWDCAQASSSGVPSSKQKNYVHLESSLQRPMASRSDSPSDPESGVSSFQHTVFLFSGDFRL
jgi:hypothetical protein